MATTTETETIAAVSDHGIPAAAPQAPSHNHEKVEEKTEQVSKVKSELVAASKETDREEENKMAETPNIVMEEQVKKADEPVSDPKARVQEEEGKVADGSMPVAESFENWQQDIAPVSDYSEKPAVLLVSEEPETDSKKKPGAAVEAKADSEGPAAALEDETNTEKPAAAQQAETETDAENPAAAQEAEAGSEKPQGIEAVVEKPEDESTPEVKPVTGTTNTTDVEAVYGEPKEVTEPKAAEESQKVEEETVNNNKSSTNDVSQSESSVDAGEHVPEVKPEAYPENEPTAKEAVESSAAADGEKVIQKQTGTEGKELTADGHVAEAKSPVVEVKEEALEPAKTENVQDSSIETATEKPKEEAVGPEQKYFTKREEDHEAAAQQISVEDEIKQQEELPQSEVTEEEAVRPLRESLQDLIRREREESLQEKDNFEGKYSTDNEKPPAVSEDTDQKQVDKEAAVEQHQQKKEDTTITEQQTPRAEEKSNTQEKQVIISEEVKPIEDNIENVHDKNEGAQQPNFKSDSSTLTQQNTEETQQEVETVTLNPSAPAAAKPATKPLDPAVPDANESKKEETPVPKSVEAENNEHVEEVLKTSDVIPDTRESLDAKEEPRKEEQDIEEADISQDQTKEDIPAKTSPKQSSNIMSKVKHSFVKAKKAIIGKSPSSKTITTDATKGDIKVK